jgi:hypothetical protein
VTLPDKPDPWTLLYALVFGVPHPVLVAVELLVALLVVAAVAAVVVRLWRGDRFAAGPLVIEHPQVIRELQLSIQAISRDDRLKANVLWAFRERLNEANRIISAGLEEAQVREWCRGVLTDALTALGEGGHDRHRASLWVRGDSGLRMYDGMGFRQEALDHARLPLASIAGGVLQTGTCHTSTDIDADASFCPKPRSGPDYQSLLAVPVKTPGGATISALCVDAEAPAYFDADHLFFAQCYADLIALLLAQVHAGERGYE